MKRAPTTPTATTKIHTQSLLMAFWLLPYEKKEKQEEVNKNIKFKKHTDTKWEKKEVIFKHIRECEEIFVTFFVTFWKF